MMDYDAKDIFDSASSFTAANQIVIEKLSQTDDVGTLIAPIVTLSSFSIELYMKCIYMIENRKPAPNKHELDKLFHLLSEESQTVIRMFYDMYVQMDPLVKVILEKAQTPKLISIVC